MSRVELIFQFSLLCIYTLQEVASFNLHRNFHHAHTKPLPFTKQFQFQSTSRTQLHAGLNIDLDTTVIPYPFQAVNNMKSKNPTFVSMGILVLVAFALFKSFNFLMQMKTDNKIITALQGVWNKVSKKIQYDVVPYITLGYRVAMAKLSLLMGKVSSTFAPSKGTAANLSDWNVCVLKERKVLPGNYVKYRFSLSDPNTYLPLLPGQELLMCTVDANEQVIKEPFFPISTSSTTGYFELIVKPDSMTLSDKFAKSLEILATGDELAFKNGKYKLNYQGSDEAITSMTIIGSGLGIAPVLQIVRGILSDPDTTVNDIEFLWMNEDKLDFIFQEEIESLELKHIEKFFTTKLLENDLFGTDLSRNDLVFEAITAYDSGRLAIICGPDYLCSKARDFLLTNEYPSDNILSIAT